MKSPLRFDSLFTGRELRTLSRLDSPARIQAFLADLTYSADDFYRSPRRVLKDREAHCFDGALFGAAALRRLGYPPLVLEMHAKHDDCHLIALYRRGGCWGAVAKSNFAGLRFREPVYRTLRELVMSYFESFYNIEREKTLRSYTRPLNLETFDRLDWMRSDEHLDAIARRLDEFRAIPLLAPQMVAALSPVDARSYKAGLLGANRAGLWRPRKSKSREHKGA
jgi:hypothetical protein